MNRQFLKFFCLLSLGATSISYAQDVQGYGNDVPLQGALSDIVPYGYTVSYGPGVDKDVHISWQGGSDWNTVIQNIASANGLTYSVRGHRISLQVPSTQTTTVVDKTTNAREKRNSQLGSVNSTTDLTASNIKSVNTASNSAYDAVSNPVYTPSQRSALHLHQGEGHLWHATSGKTINDILKDWADQAGWTVSFRSKEQYEIEASADFDGDFMSASTALLKSIHVEPRLKAIFHTGNNVLVVGNSFSQVR